jgi:hypothetical protein
MSQKVHCKGCEKEEDGIRPITHHQWARSDYYGMYTGLYCDVCYDSDNYPYKKDRYPTIEYDGFGEHLEPQE